MTSRMFCSQVTFTTNSPKCFIDTFTSHILPVGLHHHAGYFLSHLPTFILMFGVSVFPSSNYMWMFLLRYPSSCDAIACTLGWRLPRRVIFLHWMGRTNSPEQQEALIKTGTLTAQMILPWFPSSANNQDFALNKSYSITSSLTWLGLFGIKMPFLYHFLSFKNILFIVVIFESKPLKDFFLRVHFHRSSCTYIYTHTSNT